jgi:hypothetical protein
MRAAGDWSLEALEQPHLAVAQFNHDHQRRMHTRKHLQRMVGRHFLVQISLVSPASCLRCDLSGCAVLGTSGQAEF